jgi:hypothetical protein
VPEAHLLLEYGTTGDHVFTTGDQSSIPERVTWLAKALPVYPPGGNLPRSVSRLAPARVRALGEASSRS